MTRGGTAGAGTERAGRLVATVRALGPAFDLLANHRAEGFFFERGGIGVSGVGVAARVSAPGGPGRGQRLAAAAMDVLRSIGGRPEDASPRVVGAIPFHEGSPADLAVPSRSVVRRAHGATVQLHVRPEGPAPLDDDRVRWTGRAVPHDPFRDVQLRPEPSPDGYVAAVRECVRRIGAGRLRKVVLARTLAVDAERELDPKQLAWRLRAIEPGCFTFAAPTTSTDPGGTPPIGVLVGASPELLVRRAGPVVESTPLAGSAPRSGDREEDRASANGLRASTKEREEHRVVVEAVAEALAPFCEHLAFDREPVLLPTANVWHLATRFRGRLREPAPSALELVAALHPTPAVCGAPREEALRTIEELEPFARGTYAGPVGWMDANGDGEWAIALRCAELAGSTARLFAGAGIVAGSDPRSELDETERKFRAFLDSLRWG